MVGALLLLSGSAAWAQQGEAPQPPAKPHFDIWEFQVQGNTTLPVEKVERTVYPFLGKSKTIDDVEAARAALEKVYRDQGYGTVGVDIPEQSVAGGLVTLRVVEGKVEHLRVVGAHYFSQDRILETVPGLAEGQVPYFPEIQKELAQLATSPDRKITPLLRPGKEPGTTDVDLEVKDEIPLHGSIELNNDYTPNTSHLRLIGSLDYDNLFQAGQRLGLLYEVSPENREEVGVYSLSYTIPIASQFLAASFVRSDSATAAGVGSTTIFGRGKIIGLHEVVPITATADPGTVLSQSLTYGIDYKAFDQVVTIGPQTGFSTPVVYAPLSLTYSGSRSAGGGEWDWSSGLEFALRDFRSSASEFDDKRYKALDNFAILKLGGSRLEPLPMGLQLYGRLGGQVADEPLISNEQLVAGGRDSVRGYLSASVTGDSGLLASLELRSFNLAPSESQYVTEARALVFTDSAYLKIYSPLPAQQSRFEMLSTGVGLRARAPHGVSLDLDVGWPLHSAYGTLSHHPRVQASTTLAF